MSDVRNRDQGNAVLRGSPSSLPQDTACLRLCGHQTKMPHDSTSADTPAPASADQATRALAWLEKVSKACQAIAAILAVLTPIALFAVNLMTSRYLAAFGQPGLSSLGDVASYLTAMLPVVLPVVVLTAGFAALPVLPRWIATAPSRHAFVEAFGWLRPGNDRKRIGFGLYLLTHSAALVAATLLGVTFFLPKVWDHGWWVCIVAGLTTLIWAFCRAKGDATDARTEHNAHSVLVFVYANFVLTLWLALLASALLGAFRSQLAPLSPVWVSAAAAGLLVALVALHLLASATRWEGALLIVVTMGMAMVFLPGDRTLTGLALRFAKLGGGIPVAYYSPGAGSAAGPKAGCLVLAVGESRIVWFPDPKSVDDTPCDFAIFKARLQLGAQASDAGSLNAATGVRVLKQEDLGGEPSH